MEKIIDEILKFINEKKLVLSHFSPNHNDCINAFTFCDKEEYVLDIESSSKVIGLITSPKFAGNFYKTKAWIFEDPRYLFFCIQNHFPDKYLRFQSEIADTAVVSATSKISRVGVKIGPNVFIDDGVIINPGSEIGENSIIGANTVIGGQGFQFQRKYNDSGSILRVNHNGATIIGKNVEIKEFCSIHRGLFEWDSTTVGNNSKLDAHCHLGHGAKVGQNVLLCSHSNLSGNNIVGDNSYIGPGVNIPNRIKIEANVKLSIGSTVTTNISYGQHYTGNFAIPHEKFIHDLKRKFE